MKKIEGKNIKIFALICVLVIIAMLIHIFIKNNKSKNLNFGNNRTSQEIVDDFLSIKSYEAKIEVKVNSNKNENKYVLKQKYQGENNNSQEVLEPENIKGVKIIKQGENLKIENNKLDLEYVLDNYNDITNNILDLSTFIKEYKNNKNSEWHENNDEIIMKVIDEKKEKILYINKKDGMSLKMEVKNNNKNTIIYIKYIKICLNK